MKYFAFIALSFFTACGGNDDKAVTEEIKKEEPLAQSKNSESFNGKFSRFLDSYYHLKDALVLTNEDMAVTSANMLKASADSLTFTDLKADPSIVEMAKGNAVTISEEAKTLAGAKGIEEKRKSFKTISDNLYDLIRTVRYDRSVVYQQFCPMAFNDEGANWLSSTSDIKNPYFGKKMLTCGEVKDSIDFRGK